MNLKYTAASMAELAAMLQKRGDELFERRDPSTVFAISSCALPSSAMPFAAMTRSVIARVVIGSGAVRSTS
jgi:hypothetical protein